MDPILIPFDVQRGSAQESVGAEAHKAVNAWFNERMPGVELVITLGTISFRATGKTPATRIEAEVMKLTSGTLMLELQVEATYENASPKDS